MGQHSSRIGDLNIPVDVHDSRGRRYRSLRLGLKESATVPTTPVTLPQRTRAPSVHSVYSGRKIKISLRKFRSNATISNSSFLPSPSQAVPVPHIPSHFLLQAQATPSQLRDELSDSSLPPYAQTVLPHPTPAHIASRAIPSVRLKAFATRHSPTPAAREDAEVECAFRSAYPEYSSTLPLDLLRDAEFSRLRPGEVYVDSMGGALYPELLVRTHASFLENTVLGNTHSQSASSQLSTAHVAAAREAVLFHFNAPVGSKVIFTANASQALKLVGESFPFGDGSTYLLPEDAHNSVHGIREFARRAGAETVYMPSRPGRGGIDAAQARVLLDANAPMPGEYALAAFTGLSNLTNTKISLSPIASVTTVPEPGARLHERKHSKGVSDFSALPTPPPSATQPSFPSSATSPMLPPLFVDASPLPSANVPNFLDMNTPSLTPSSEPFRPSLLALAKAFGYITLLDAAALAPSTALDLTATPVDAVAISFYKMFGYPTGVGALILAPGMAELLLERRGPGAGGRPWFAGGTVDIVQVPGYVVTRTKNLEEAFEDGTLNYLQLPSIPLGLNLLRSYLPFIPTRLAALAHFLASQLTSLTHPNGAPAVRVLSRVPSSIGGIGGAFTRRLPRVRGTGNAAMHLVPDSAWQSDEDRDGEGSGGTVSFVVLEPNGDMVPLSCIAASAATEGIMLRTGCMCNPGGAAALLGLSPFMSELSAGATLSQLEEAAGYELGVIRVSFGLVSNFKDAWAVACWARKGVAESWEGFRDANAHGCYPPPIAM